MTLPKPVPALGAVGLLVLVLSVVRIDDLPLAFSAAFLALAALAAWRPDVALLGIGAALPLSSWFGREWTQSGLMWPNALMVAFGCGYCARLAVHRGEAPPDRVLRASTLVLAAVVGASLLVELAVYLERLGVAGLRAELWRMAAHDFFVNDRPFPAVTTAALLLEGLLLYYAAARAAAHSPGFGPSLCRAVAFGAAITAAVNIWRLVEAAGRRESPVAAFIDLLRTQRLNYIDVNAAGSYFVVALWIAIALTAARRAWGLAAGAIAAGLWLSGSRSAMQAAVIAAVVPVLLHARRTVAGRARLRAGLVGASLLIAALAALVILPHRGNQQSAGTAMQVRVGMAQASLRMTASSPLFGVGVGEFYQRSGEFITPELAVLFPPARNENAHNNFLQILAELGVVGLAAFLWVIGLAVRRLAALLGRAPGEALPRGLAVGLAAFGLSCMAGHPLLVPEVAGIFWLVLGVVAGMGAPSPGAPARQGSISRWIPAAMLILAVTVPVRARQQVAESDMEHVGIGMLTGWRRTDDNLLYREAGAASSVFVPGEAGSITIPLRATGSGATMDVAIDLDGKPANVVHVEGDHWTSALVVLPARSGGPRFRRVSLRVVKGPNVPAEGAVLLVGKVIPH